MEMKVDIPFQKLLAAVRLLSPTQKRRLKRELDNSPRGVSEQDEVIDFLLKGPVYSTEDIKTIEDNRKDIAAWRTDD